MVIAFGFILTYLVSQLCGVAHGNGKKRYLLDDDTAQMGLMVSLSVFTADSNDDTNQHSPSSTGSSAKSSTHSPLPPSKSASVSSFSASPSIAFTFGLFAGS